MTTFGKTIIATPTITLIKARKILGKKYNNLKDKELDIILRSLYALSNRVIQNI
ncbi:MAG: hypothetical protein Q8L37_04360 [Candidatus Gottesmanbacteria bacterium]|nr:hypothetical protein [Candidatus Gottesmanbacteria bacterium]